MTGEPPDRELAGRILAGRDEEAFRILYRRHTPVLYAVAMRICSEPADAEDIVHDAWVRAADALPRFEWRSTLRTWLVGIVVNRARELDRRARRVTLVDESALGDEAPLVLPPAADAIDLERAIAALPERCRRVLVLHDIEGFTHEETAAMLGLETGTSKSHLWRARQLLRQRLSPRREAQSP